MPRQPPTNIRRGDRGLGFGFSISSGFRLGASCHEPGRNPIQGDIVLRRRTGGMVVRAALAPLPSRRPSRDEPCFEPENGRGMFRVWGVLVLVTPRRRFAESVRTPRFSEVSIARAISGGGRLRSTSRMTTGSITAPWGVGQEPIARWTGHGAVGSPGGVSPRASPRRPTTVIRWSPWKC